MHFLRGLWKKEKLQGGTFKGHLQADLLILEEWTHFLFLKTKTGLHDSQMRFFDSMKLVVSKRSCVNISEVDLAPGDSPIGVFCEESFNATNKPQEALKSLNLI